MKQRLTLLLLLVLTMPLAGTAREAWRIHAGHDEGTRAIGTTPCKGNEDHLWGAQERKTDHTAFVDTSANSALQAPRAESHAPSLCDRPLRIIGRIPDLSRFNPYHLIIPGWRRRQLHATHPYALSRYYVFALRHIIR